MMKRNSKKVKGERSNYMKTVRWREKETKANSESKSLRFELNGTESILKYEV